MKFPNWLRVYGDKGFRGDCPREDIEQITYCDCADVGDIRDNTDQGRWRWNIY